jgi:hypothetical protein
MNSKQYCCQKNRYKSVNKTFGTKKCVKIVHLLCQQNICKSSNWFLSSKLLSVNKMIVKWLFVNKMIVVSTKWLLCQQNICCVNKMIVVSTKWLLCQQNICCVNKMFLCKQNICHQKCVHVMLVYNMFVKRKLFLKFFFKCRITKLEG